MTDLVRQEIATAAHTIVVKVGTRVLTGADGLLEPGAHRRAGRGVAPARWPPAARWRWSAPARSAPAWASSGLAKRPTNLAQLQAVAAVGQSHLIEAYDRGLRAHGRHAAQLLLTADDLDDRTRYLNVRNTLLALFEFGAVPIINENDTVSVDELQTTFGDNDRLAAMVTNLIRAPLLVLLSDVDGLYDGDPRDPGSKLIPTVTRLDASIFDLVRDSATGLSKGGMASKLEAARIATTAGENVIIANGRTPGNLARIVAGETVGTLFLAQGQTVCRRQALDRLHGPAARHAGARRRRPRGGREERQEPAGRSAWSTPRARFSKGDVVALRDAGGIEFARGLTNYALDDLLKIKGLKTEQDRRRPGPCPYDEVIHRDNMALTRDAVK